MGRGQPCAPGSVGAPWRRGLPATDAGFDRRLRDITFSW